MNHFIQYLRQIAELPEQEEEKLLKLLKIATIPKGTYYIQEGQIPRRFGFLHQGLFRYLYKDSKGNEFTKNFLPEKSFVISYSAMVMEKPSKMFIEALEDSVICELEYKDWRELRNGNNCWNLFLIALLEKAFATKENRERDLLLLNAQERYEGFKKEFPGLENRIKQHLIASYLGISPVSLSRLKNRSPLT